MASPPIATLTDIRLGFGGRPLFDGVTASIGRGDRLALIGRNGSGKSTLLKVMAGVVAPDAGERFVQPGARVAYLAQDPDMTGFATLGDFAAADLDEHERYKVEIAMEGLDLRPERAPSQASGGERRRAALARALAAEPELMLLDEPTNHLDIRAIEWLERTLAASSAGFVLVSHDRAFLTALTRQTLWLDRGRARRLEQGFAAFEDWRDKVFDEEDAARHKLDRKIVREEHWIVHGVSGRRKRNMRRVADLAALRQARRDAIRRPDAAAMALETGQASSKLVIEAEGVAKRYDGRTIVAGFSTRIQRGDRVALVGPNGVGKTTLLNLLIGEATPDEGRIRRAQNLTIAQFDQARAALDPTKSLWQTLTDDKDLGAAHDQVLVRGKPKHVVGYLKEFLFSEEQARGPVSALSGGERARLLLARIMARESNLLVLDEPTNDLDVETLDLLVELLSDYDGTLLLVSHDRDFVDRIASSTIAMEGDGRATEYAGGWSDYRAQARLGGGAKGPAAPAPVSGETRRAETRAESQAEFRAESRAEPTAAAKAGGQKLSFNQKRRLETLPGEMARLADEIGKLEALLADSSLYTREPKKFDQATRLLTERKTKLAAAEDEWLELEALREAIEGA